MFLKIINSLKIIIPLALGITLLATLLHINNAPEHLSHVELDPIFFLLTIFINLLLYGIFARRWQLLVIEIDRDASVTWTQCLFYYVTAAGTGLLIPNSAAMISVGAGALERFHRIPLKKGAATIVLEKCCDIFPIIFSIPPVLLLIMKFITVPQAFLILPFNLFLISIIFCLAVDKIENINHPVVKQITGIHINIEKHTLLKVYGLTLITQILQMIRVWLIAKTVGIDMTLPIAILGMAGNQASSLLSITPSGLGLKEGALYLTFNAAGLLPEQISVYIIAYRSLTSLFLPLFWLPLYCLWVASRKENLGIAALPEGVT